MQIDLLRKRVLAGIRRTRNGMNTILLDPDFPDERRNLHIAGKEIILENVIAGKLKTGKKIDPWAIVRLL